MGDWLSRIDKDSKEARDRRIFDLWLACRTGAEIAKDVGLSEGEVSKTLDAFQTAGLPDGKKPSALHQTDFDPPIYNVWKQQEKTAGSNRREGPAVLRGGGEEEAGGRTTQRR